MKALILNSGLGKRMEELTADRPKCMVEIVPGIAAVDLQVQKLLACGIRDIVMTTGPFADFLEAHLTERYPEARITYFNNPVYDKTNYIYSIYLAREALQDEDIVLMHGDLAFETKVLRAVLGSKTSVMTVDSTLPLPEKDFKAVLDGEKVVKVGIEFFENAVEAQPLYLLKKEDWNAWLARIVSFCEAGNTSVYAENALNEIADGLNIRKLDLQGRFCAEVDNKDDLENFRVHFDLLQ